MVESAVQAEAWRKSALRREDFGGHGFVMAALKDAEERKQVLLPTEDRFSLLDEDIKRACKSGKLSGLKKEVAGKTVFEYGLSLAETARQPVVTINAGSCMLSRRAECLGICRNGTSSVRMTT
jgi:hypothetical protein